jgi:hypothetical protein
MSCPPRLREFGNALHRLLYFKKEVWEILPKDWGTWVAGGCRILAEALHGWIGPRSSMWALKGSRYHNVNHVVVRVGDCYLDGDGASTERALLKRWEEFELVPDPYLRPFRPEEAMDLECPTRPIRALVAALEEEFGSGPALMEWALAPKRSSKS